MVVLIDEEEKMVSRRGFLSGLGVASVSGTLGGRRVAASPEANDVYKDLGVRPFINAAGTYTALSASLMPPEVRQAMENASRRYVSSLLVAMIHAGLGDSEAAFASLEKAYEGRETWLPFLMQDMGYEPLRVDGRLDALIRRTGVGRPHG